MRANIKILLTTIILFSTNLYSKSTPLKPVNLSIKKDFLTIPKKIIKLKKIDLLKPVSVSLDDSIDFKEVFSLMSFITKSLKA